MENREKTLRIIKFIKTSKPMRERDKSEKFIYALIKSGLTNSCEGSFDRNKVMKMVYSNDFLDLAAGLKIDNSVNLIKGLCLFEALPGMQFGSTTRIPKLLDLLRKCSNSTYVELVDWLFINRTNSYIPYGRDVSLDIKFELEYRGYRRKREKHQQKMEKLNQQKHKKTQASKQKNR